MSRFGFSEDAFHANDESQTTNERKTLNPYETWPKSGKDVKYVNVVCYPARNYRGEWY